MSSTFKVGDHVTWSSPEGEITGRIVTVHHADITFLGKTRRASKDRPQYEVQSEKTGAHAMHKGAALNKS